jgi:hypothetical protein
MISFHPPLHIVERGGDLEHRDAARVAAVKKPVHIQVLIVPTGPCCPGAVRTARRLAWKNKQITADMVDLDSIEMLLSGIVNF